MQTVPESIARWVGPLILASSVGWVILQVPPATESAPAPPLSRDAVQAPSDSLDWPISLNTGPDGSVWLAMRTDTGTGGAVQYDADLVYQRRWSTDFFEIPDAIAVHSSHDVFLSHRLRVPHQSTLVRHAPDGNQVQTWDIMEANVMQLDAGPEGTLFALEDLQSPHALTPPPPQLRRIGHYTADGTRLARWDVDIRTAALAAGADGRVYAGDRAGPLGGSGNVVRFNAQGARETSWVVGGEPAGMAVLPGGDLAVLHLPELANRAQVEIFTPDGQSLRDWDVPDEVSEGGYTQPIDLATGPDCNIYALVNLRPENVRALYHYTCEGRLVGVLRDFVQITGPTPTPGAPATRTPDGGSPTSPPPTPTPSHTSTPESSTPTPSATPNDPPTTPSPAAYLPWANRAEGMAP